MCRGSRAVPYYDDKELAGLWDDPRVLKQELPTPTAAGEITPLHLPKSRKAKRKGNIIMGMNDLYQKQCKEEKGQLEKSLADIIKMISMLEIGVKQYPENTAFKLSQFYRGMLNDARLGKEICENRIAELTEKIE